MKGRTASYRHVVLALVAGLGVLIFSVVVAGLILSSRNYPAWLNMATMALALCLAEGVTLALHHRLTRRSFPRVAETLRKTIITMLLTCELGILALWGATREAPTAFQLEVSQFRWAWLHLEKGHLRFEYASQTTRARPRATSTLDLGVFGVFSIDARDTADAWRFRSLVLPLWSLVIALGVYPVIAIIYGPYHRYRRRRDNRCVHCGYHLTGLTGSTCPECGNPLASPTCIP